MISLPCARARILICSLLQYCVLRSTTHSDAKRAHFPPLIVVVPHPFILKNEEVEAHRQEGRGNPADARRAASPNYAAYPRRSWGHRARSDRQPHEGGETTNHPHLFMQRVEADGTSRYKAQRPIHGKSFKSMPNTTRHKQARHRAHGSGPGGKRRTLPRASCEGVERTADRRSGSRQAQEARGR